MVASRSYIKCLKSTCEISIVCWLAEILQLALKIRNFPEVLFKKGVLKNFSKFRDKHIKQLSGGVLLK